ncbi:YfaZ family outer membrane protein [Marinomonas sp. THO17]|uniref:YfaZ family outer membrane protein n=1 Tax=Marinomonas sp. THO17 TaxID=3149048 RepID=UPI00336BBA36
MNLNLKALFLTLGLLGSSIATAASTATVHLTNDTVQGDVNLDMGTFGLGGGVSYDKDESITAGYLGFNVQDSEGASGPLQIGIGARVYAVEADRTVDDDDIYTAIALGGWYRYTLQEANRVAIYGSGYYAPEVLSFTNLDHMYTYEFRLEYMTMRNARAFVRYGNTVIVFDDNSRKEANTGFAVGAEVEF